jgi:hypothetical protein
MAQVEKAICRRSPAATFGVTLRGLPDFRVSRLGAVVAAAAVAAALAVGSMNASVTHAGCVTTTPHLSVTAAVTSQSASAPPPIGTPFETESPSLAMTKPADGRLNGYGFSLRVLAYGVATSFSSSFGGESAPAGETMAVVTYDLQSYDDGDAVSPDLYFVAGNQRAPLGTGSVGGIWSWAVSVPTNVPVGFAVSEVGLTQELSFTTGARVGASPQELYRSPAGPDITKDYDRTVSLKVVDRHKSAFRTLDQLTLDSVELTYFSPVNPLVQPASVNGAFLVVNASEQSDPASQDTLGWSAAMPASRMRLVLPGGRVIEANPSRSTNGAPPEDLLDANYYFDVPASITKATIEITPGTNAATEYGPDNNGNSQDTILGTASFAVSFPPPPKVTPTKPSKSTSTTTSRPRGVPTTEVVHRRPAPLPAQPVRFPTPLKYIALAVLALGMFLARSVFVRDHRRSAPVLAGTSAGYVEQPAAVAVVPGYTQTQVFVSGPDGASRSVQEEPVETERFVVEAPAAPPQAVADATSVEAEPTDDPMLRPDAVVNFLGPIEVTGLAFEPRRKVALELLCFLACHRHESYTAEAIRAKLWPPNGEDASATSFRSYVSALRAVIGKGQLPIAAGGFYELGDGVDTDWDRFRTLVAFAQIFRDDERMLLSSALGLIRGPLFSGVPIGRYAWAFEPGGLVNEIEVAVNAAASQLAELSFAAADPGPALAGLATALVATKDFGVADDLLTAAGATGSLPALEQAWCEVTSALGEDAERFRRSYEALGHCLKAPSSPEPCGTG